MKNTAKTTQNILNRLLVPALLALGLAAQQTARAHTLNVPAQYSDTQSAVTAAAAGDLVLVANGTYTGSADFFLLSSRNTNIDFGGKNITVKSSGGPANCTIDCQGGPRLLFSQWGDSCKPRGGLHHQERQSNSRISIRQQR